MTATPDRILEEIKRHLDKHLLSNSKCHDLFTGGKCHDLAIAFLRHFNRGAAYACIREMKDADTGEVFSITYSHAVYEDHNGDTWDIDGFNADERWKASTKPKARIMTIC